MKTPQKKITSDMFRGCPELGIPSGIRRFAAMYPDGIILPDDLLEIQEIIDKLSQSEGFECGVSIFLLKLSVNQTWHNQKWRQILKNSYLNGLKHGISLIIDSTDGRILSSQEYLGGEIHGEHISYLMDGTPFRKDIYKSSECLTHAQPIKMGTYSDLKIDKMLLKSMYLHIKTESGKEAADKWLQNSIKQDNDRMDRGIKPHWLSNKRKGFKPRPH